MVFVVLLLCGRLALAAPGGRSTGRSTGTASGIIQGGESILGGLTEVLDVEKDISEKATEVFSTVKHLVEIAEDMIKRMYLEMEFVEREHLKLMTNRY